MPKYGPEDSKRSPRFTGIRTYARLPHVSGSLSDTDVAVLGIPFDTGATFRVGARFGPERIRSASALIRPYHTASAISPFDYLSVVDYGDIAVVPGYIEESQVRIRAGLQQILEQRVIPISMGGDHSISLPELRAIAAAYGPVGLIDFDAHSDTSDEYFGQPYTHGTPFYHAIREGLIDPSRAIQIGLRGPVYSKRDYEIPVELGMEVITAAEVHGLGIAETARRVRARAGVGPVFLTFDIDFVDPAFAPGTGTPEVGGFTTWESQALVRELHGIRFVGFDVVEVLPDYDVAETTSLLAANLIFEFLTLLACSVRGQR